MGYVQPNVQSKHLTYHFLDLLRFVVVLGPTSSVIDILTFCLGYFYYGIQTTDDPNAVKQFQTHWFLQG